MTFVTRSVVSAVVSIGTHMLVLCGAVLVATASLSAQNDAQEKGLRAYQWIETTELTWNGDAQPPSQQLCRYGPDGRIQKTPIGPARETLSDSGTRDMHEYLRDAEALIGAYELPDAREIEHAYRARTVSLNPTGTVVNLVFKDYVRPGDQMTLAFDTSARKIVSVNIDTPGGSDQDAVTFRAQMAGLPDGTTYVRQTVLTAGGTRLTVTRTNARFRILGLATPEERSN